MITSISVSDILISPHQSSQLDLDTIEELQEQISRVKDLNPNLKPFILQTMATPNHTVKSKERLNFKEYLEDYFDLQLLKSCLYYRKIYKDVMPLGKSVVEENNALAKKEIQDLIQEVF